MTPSISSLHEPSIEEALKTQIQTIALTLRGDSVDHYRVAARRFLCYLGEAFPEVQNLSQLRRDTHMLGWFRSLAEGRPVGKKARADYYISLRRLLRDCQHCGYAIASDLVLSHDIPPVPHCLPRALSLEDDRLLDQELRRRDDLLSNALRLMRATGIRIGECMDLSLDCMRHFGENQWALHVPIGKLYTERLVPVDEDARQLVARILSLRSLAPSSERTHSESFLLPRPCTRKAFYKALRAALLHAGQRAGCAQPITPHRLRHTYASEMIRLGVTLPAVMQLLGHKDIRMTMRYLQVTQNDLQNEFRKARKNALQHHDLPQLAVPLDLSVATADLPGIRLSITATRHLLEMYRRQLHNEPVSRCLQRLDKRLLTIDSELKHLEDEQK